MSAANPTSGLLPKSEVLRFPVGAVAAGVDLLTPAFVAPYAGGITSVKYIPRTTLTGANTDSRTCSLINETGSGTPTMASKAFTSGVNITANTAGTITNSGTAANLLFAAGDVVAWNSAHVGATGLADSGGTVEITIYRD